MSRLDALPPDQRAALSLLLRQGKSYAEVAALLSIPERAVHDRAHAALAVLAPRQARELTAARRGPIGDYLLGQQTGVAERLQTRTYLDGSAAARAWASAISAELAPLAATPLPEIPSPTSPPADRNDADDEPSSPRASAASPARIRPPGSLPSSRRGGVLLLAAIAAAVIVAVILLAGGGGSSSHTGTTIATGSSAGQTSTNSKGSTTTGGPTEDKRLSLTSPDPAGKSVGVVEILSEGSKRAFYIAAEHLPSTKGFFYAVWLYNSPTSSQALSRSPAVGSSGRLQGGALLPANAGEYHKMLLTRETNERPTRPGPVVLSGTFALH
jgi:Sigma-70, region 4